MHMDVCSNTWQGWDGWYDREARKASTDAAKWKQQEVEWKNRTTGWQTTYSEAREGQNSDNANTKRLKARHEENWDRNTSDHSSTVVRTPPDIKGDDVKFDLFAKERANDWCVVIHAVRPSRDKTRVISQVSYVSLEELPSMNHLNTKVRVAAMFY
jgi:hypothetical protein